MPTVPSLVLLTVLVAGLVAAALGARVGGVVLAHLRRVVRSAARRPTVPVADSWCPRVVLIDDDRWTPAAA